MQNPALPHTSFRTCHGCGSEVEPDHKFCQSCGTRMPELPACSRCGTQFIIPVNYCELCGAPVNPGVEPEQGDEPDYVFEENSGPFGNEVAGRVEGKNPELPKKVPDEEPVGSETKHREEGLRKSRPVRQAEAVNDALFFSPKKPGAPAQSQLNTARIIGGSVVAIAIIAAVFFIGLPMLAGSGGSGAHNQPAMTITPVPATTVVVTTRVPTPTPASRAFTLMPTQQVPPGQKLYFQVRKSPVDEKISVIFAGSAGEDRLISADIKVTHPDGSFATGMIQPLKSVTEISLDGSKEADRVEIIAKMSSGTAYRVYDDLVTV